MGDLGFRPAVCQDSVRGQVVAQNPITGPGCPFRSPFLPSWEVKSGFSPHVRHRPPRRGLGLLGAQSPASLWPPERSPPPEVPGAAGPVGGWEALRPVHGSGLYRGSCLPLSSFPRQAQVCGAGLGGMGLGSTEGGGS